jgi:phosphatidylserine/phosphatidylglycerophosphate/cardiolipin synthase-like enzyme
MRSLDIQTYIWHADLTGVYFAEQLLAATDRGVRVRLLLDDMDARAKNDGYAALAAHPNIDIRMFNPFASRSGTLALHRRRDHEFRAHQSTHAQQELDCRQPVGDRRRPQRGR